MNAITYCRVSTVEQTRNLSLSTQRAACKNFCAQHGYEVIREFIERGESAKTTDRPVLNELMDFCRRNKGRVDILVVYNLSRFARDQAGHVLLRCELRKLGVSLKSVTEPIDETAEGRLIEGVLSSIAEFENLQKASRTRAGMMAAIERGRWVWVPPVGYRPGSRSGASIIPDKDEAAIISVAFETLATGTGTVADALAMVNALGLRTRESLPLTAQSFHALLRNPIYAGSIVVKKWGVERQGDFEAAVSYETFSRVQQVLSTRGPKRKRYRRLNEDFPLRRFVRCSYCSAPLTASWSRGRSQRYGYYHCPKCAGVRVEVGRLAEEFLDLLDDLEPSPQYLRLFEAVVRDVWAERRKQSGDAAGAIERRIADLWVQLNQIEEAFVIRRDIDRESYVTLRDRCRRELAAAEVELEEARIEEVDLDAALAASAEILGNASGLWLRATVEQRVRLQAAIFPEGLTYDGRGFGTAQTCIVFMHLQSGVGDSEGVASPTGLGKLDRVGRLLRVA